MEVLTAREVVARLAETCRDPRLCACGAAIAFDGDGTLWTGDIGDDFFHAMVAGDRLQPAAIAAMREVGRAAGLGGMDAQRLAGAAVPRRLFEAYADGRLAEDVVCEVVAWMCAGWREEDVHRFARALIGGSAFRSRHHAEVGPILDWARANGVDAFVVSASPRAVVEAAAEGFGFDAAHVLAVTPVCEGGTVLPDVVRPIPYGPGKERLLHERLQGRVLVAAFGDNVFDLPMLRAACLPVLVEPKARLLAEIDRLGGTLGAASPKPVRLRVPGAPPSADVGSLSAT